MHKMKLDIVLPSKGRLHKLYRCLDSIYTALHMMYQLQDWVIPTVHVYFSDDFERAATQSDYFDLNTHIISEYSAPALWNGHVAEHQPDTLCYLSDDVVLDEMCLVQGLYCMEEHFIDGDGVVGFYQKNIPPESTVQGSFGLIGKYFMQRFPGMQAFCPIYERFYIDQELTEYAKSVNKFVHCKDATMYHYHHCHSPEPLDATGKDVRTRLSSDKATWQRRSSLGYLWGKNFHL